MAKNLEHFDPGHELRAWRVRAGLTQAQLAGMLGTFQPTISDLESRKVSPSLPLAVRIQELTGIPAPAWVVVDYPLTKDAADGSEAHAS